MQKHIRKSMKAGVCLILAFCLLLCLFAQDAIVLKANAAEAQWLWPATNCYIVSSNFGNRDLDGNGVMDDQHRGIDIVGSGTTFGQPVRAAKSGTVYDYCNSLGDEEKDWSSTMKSYGNYVILKHDDGTYTIYAHMRKSGVKTSGTVKQGDVIGYIGNSGSSYGSHLHFQIFTNPLDKGSTSLNPMPTNSNITIRNTYSLPSGWASQKQTYIFEVAPTEYTISFDANGGYNAPASVTKTHGEDLTLPSTVPFWFGHSFMWWSAIEENELWLFPGEVLEVDKNLTFQAMWSDPIDIPASDVASIDSVYSTSTYICFANQEYWYSFTPATPNTALQFRGAGEIDSQIYLYDAIGNPLEFDDDDGDGLQFLLNYVFPDTNTYYIRVRLYGQNTGGLDMNVQQLCTVRYNANGGTGAPSSQNAIYDTSLQLYENIPTRTGYNFLGWATSSSATSAAYQPGDYIYVTGDTTLYAVWEPVRYTISYNANGGTGAPSSQAKLHNVALTLSTTVPDRFPYSFLGWWAMSSSSDDVTYYPGDTYMDNYSDTLYAKWDRPETIPSDAVGANCRTSIDFVNQYRYYAFTPEMTGTYTFESTGDLDTRIYLYDNKGTQLGYNDDAGSGNNFLLTRELIGGTQYYFKVKLFSTGTGTINFSVNRSVPKFTSHPVDTFVNEEQGAIFTVAATGTGLTYQWQFKPAGDDEWYDNSCTSSTLTINPTYIWRNGYQYRCKITDAYGWYTYSNPATLTVTPAITIITQPINKTATAGNNVNFSVTAGGSNLSYQWQYRTSSTGTWANAIAPGNQTATLSVPATMSKNGYQYRCKITNGTSVVYSNTVTLTVNPAITITKQPTSVTTTPAGKATFTVAATGTGLTYQWQFRANANAAWTNNTCKTATLTFNPAESWRNGYQYRCVITDSSGNKAYTDAATLTVKAAITITKQPTSVTTTPAGKATFTVAATGTGLTYQWQFRANSTAAWTNNTCKTATLTFNPAESWRNGYQYRCVITDSSGNKAYTNAATLTVKAAITITKQPTSVTTTAAGNATFTVAATGTGLTYQWQFRANSTAAWTNNTCKTATLTFNPAESWRNGYQYRCVITDANGNKAYTNAVTLTVK